MSLLKSIEERFKQLNDNLGKNNLTYQEKTNERIQEISY
jgi:hypothetical protein